MVSSWPRATVRVRFSRVTSPKSGENASLTGGPAVSVVEYSMSMLLSLKPSPLTGAAYHQLRS